MAVTTGPGSGSARGASSASRVAGVDSAGVGEAGDVLASLDAEQRAVAEVVSGPVCVLAGAGTGKTRAVTHRVAHAVRSGAVAPEHVLAVTFTARAAGELRERLRGLGVAAVTARTFHAAALRQLQYFWPVAIGGSAPPLLEHKAPLVSDAVGRLGLRVDRATVRDLSAEIEWAKVSLLVPDTYPEAAASAGRGEVAGHDAVVVARVLAAYEDAKSDRGVLDFEDVLLLTAGMLEHREDVARQVRDRYRWFTVDEYQDVSAAQQRLLTAWLGPRSDVCVVGDPHQTIYTFAGANASLLRRFPQQYPDAAVIRLVRNYRSRPAVVELGGAVLARAATPPSAALRATRPGPGEPATFTAYDDDLAEAAGVARRLRRHLDQGGQPAAAAVLVRTNAQLEALEDALGEANVPYVVRGGERFFARREVREAVVLLRGAAKGTPEGASDDLAGEVAAVLSGMGWSPEPPAGRGQVRERWESLGALVAHAERLAAAELGAGLRSLLADLETRAAQQHAPRLTGVTLATLHAAKGLEWDLVFLPGLAEGLLPIAMATSAAAVEEERRLLYVGVTRAREQVHLSWARSRTPGGRGSRRPSRFLDGIRPAEPGENAGAVGRPGRSPRRVPARPAQCRSCGVLLTTAAQRTAGRCPDCPARCDPAVLAALRAWRATAAADADVPPYVVFTDATVEAIAERRPTAVTELAAVPGVGRVKLDRYGEEVLAVLRIGHATTDEVPER